jgi:DNA end-binding protein Ku
LVTVPVRVYTAISTTEKIAFNQLHKSCHQRLHQKLVCPIHGEVERAALVKGYEYATDKFVIVNETELESVRLETTGTIELIQFARPDELDPLFLDTPYYVGPDGRVAEQGFAVLREALPAGLRIKTSSIYPGSI